MFDAMKLLGSIAEHTSAPSAPDRFGAAVQQSTNTGMLQQVLAQFGGSGAQPGGASSFLQGLSAQGTSAAPAAPGQGGLGGMLGQFAEMARRAMVSPKQEVQSGNPAAVGGLGALAGALLDGGRGAVGGGLLAVLGSMAYSALQNQGAGPANAPGTAPSGAGPQPKGAFGGTPSVAAPASQAEAQRKAMLMIRAMIQAAKADGRIDEQETQRIMGKLGDHGHSPEAHEFVVNEMSRPIDIPGLVRDVTSSQEAAEVYAASLMAIELDSQSERDYLADLAGALGLPPATVNQINNALNVTA